MELHRWHLQTQGYGIFGGSLDCLICPKSRSHASRSTSWAYSRVCFESGGEGRRVRRWSRGGALLGEGGWAVEGEMGGDDIGGERGERGEVGESEVRS